MGQVIIRNLEDSVIAALKLRAEIHGHSLEQELREILRQAAPLDAIDRLALSDRLRAMTSGKLATDSTDLIRQDRDSR